MATLPEPAREFLASGPLAHVATTNRDGSAQISCVWVKVDGDTLVIASLGENQKIKNLRRDPRIALSFQASKTNPMGITEYLIVHGQATIEAGGAPELLQELAYTYIGPGVRFPAMDNPPPGYLIRIHVERIGGVGSWAEEARES
jgi:PPOX class probable F420-dependent enzyme